MQRNNHSISACYWCLHICQDWLQQGNNDEVIPKSLLRGLTFYGVFSFLEVVDVFGGGFALLKQSKHKKMTHVSICMLC